VILSVRAEALSAANGEESLGLDADSSLRSE